MSVSSLASNILVYRMIRLLSSKYNTWSYFDDGIIDEDGKIINKSKATSYLKFVINIKKLISFHPMGKLKLSSLPLALSLIKESTDEININEELMLELLEKAEFIYRDN